MQFVHQPWYTHYVTRKVAYLISGKTATNTYGDRRHTAVHNTVHTHKDRNTHIAYFIPTPFTLCY